MEKITMLLSKIIDLIFPNICSNCEKELPGGGGNCCQECWKTIPINQTYFCLECRARQPEKGSLNCHKQNPQLAAGTNYENPIVQRLIKQLKFENIKSASIPLARILEHCEPLKSYCAQPNTIIVPIPLGKKRLRQRGYNQSGLIAEQLQKNIGVRVEKNLLMRVKNTKPQTELAHGNARRENIKGCFEINKKTIVSKESNIVLLDDVATTGATLQEAADILKKNGYKKIIVTVIAKT